MKQIRNRDQLRLGGGICTGGLAALVAFQLVPDGPVTQRIIGAIFLKVAVAALAGWAGWRVGIVLPDLTSAELRSERWRVIQRSVGRVTGALIHRRTLVVVGFAALAAVGMNATLENELGPAAGAGWSEPASLRALVTGWLSIAAAASVGGWIGWFLDRTRSRLVDEEVPPNR